jgi:hypothetical protein
MNMNPTPNLIPPTGDTTKTGIPPLSTHPGTLPTNPFMDLPQLPAYVETRVGIPPLGGTSETGYENPFAGFSQLPCDIIKNGSPPSANLGTNHGSREAHENCGPTVTGSQPPSTPLDFSDFAAAAPEPLDPEDLTAFALPDDYESSVAKKVLNTVPVRKPSKESFVRTNPDPAMWRTYSILELKEEGRTYIVTPQLAVALDAEGESTLTNALLVPTVDRRGNFFLWILKLSDRESSWHLSGNRAAELAKTKWVRIQSNMSAGAYDTCVAENQDAQPVWPEEDLATILKIAFEGKVITSRDHPVLKELRGGN